MVVCVYSVVSLGLIMLVSLHGPCLGALVGLLLYYRKEKAADGPWEVLKHAAFFLLVLTEPNNRAVVGWTELRRVNASLAGNSDQYC